MQVSDYKKFSGLWSDAHEIMAGGKVFSKRAMDMIFEALGDYSMDIVEWAIKMHCKKSKFAPTPNDIIDLLESCNKRLSADEAWAMMPNDEFETVVWTDEMAEAYNIAYDMIVEGDRIAARMAFKGAYERLCTEAVIMQRPVVWKACIGYDKNKIEPALQKAVAAGRIPQDRANKFFPPPMDAGPIAGLLAGKITEFSGDNENLKARWSEIKQAIDDGQRKMDEKDRQQVIEREERRFEFERKCQEMLFRVDEKLKNALEKF